MISNAKQSVIPSLKGNIQVIRLYAALFIFMKQLFHKFNPHNFQSKMY